MNSFYKSCKGIGIRSGLYMGKNIIEDHGGKICAKNNEDDEK
jgi:nitrogen fixation/metabolism regulation signal transduction histidine kinase